jgi:quercetin dioxygenase-like cupin family protein
MVIEKMPRVDWQPLLRPGAAGVAARVMLNRAGIVIAGLRLAPGATIDEHCAPFDIDVVCLDGQGFVSIGGESSPFSAGERVVWPAGINHRLWTAGCAMETLMVERKGA